MQWRRRGPALELNFEKPIGDKMWRKNAFSPGAIPWLWGIGWGVAGIAGYAALAVIGGVISLFAGAAILPPLAVLIGGLVVGPAAGIAGFLAGRKKQDSVRERQATEYRYTEAITDAVGNEYRGAGAKTFLNKIAEVMRTGRPLRANVLSVNGYAEFSIEPIGPSSIRIQPLEIPAEGKLYNKLARQFVSKPVDESLVTAPVDKKMAVLEERLEAIRKVGNIDSRHQAYPQFSMLQVDRISEYRQLASRANRVASINSPEAQATAMELLENLDHVVDLMKVGVDELEVNVLKDAEIRSDAHLIFLRDKYNRLEREE
ncbi:hypothetical protein C7K25_12645 [Gulosibacter molinativorax]|uniref:5-bromo-4-chloroindolyl phosphate hydrolysis protein n=1 Tax=Gulosibacter molinativorax TaxID=256821 RepID=A0ABT7CAU6_9MICO|nr:hypothetical protein [Gulosibacter molinativorax]QUY60919.1 Hypotetical protein [Gulosibacter molinativorax]